jgi:hypothetical protein
MSIDPFFCLEGPVREFDSNQLSDALETSAHIRNVLYRPRHFDIRKKRVEGITFENVSFSKTDIGGVTFKECKFIRCLFIGTNFTDVEFHSCSFTRSNFFKATFKAVYGKPEQFSSAVIEDRYANIGVHLYQELRDNYKDEAQPEFMREAEYQFRKWSQKLLWTELVKKQSFSARNALQWLGLAVYRLLFGYGLRLRNLLGTTLLSVLVLTMLARSYASGMFLEEHPVTWIRGIYFTISTMITLGAIGFTPKSDAGYMFLLLNAVAGVVLLSATLNAFSKRVSR